MKGRLFILLLIGSLGNSIKAMDYPESTPIPRTVSPLAAFKDYVQTARAHSSIKCRLCATRIHTDFLISHYQTKHQQEVFFKYQCEICKQSVTESDQARHMHANHQDLLRHRWKFLPYLATTSDSLLLSLAKPSSIIP